MTRPLEAFALVSAAKQACVIPCGLPELRYRECTQGCTTRGLADEEIQLDLLGEKNQNMILEEELQLVEAKKSGKRSAGQLL